jgi:hypothetical protein
MTAAIWIIIFKKCTKFVLILPLKCWSLILLFCVFAKIIATAPHTYSMTSKRADKRKQNKRWLFQTPHKTCLVAINYDEDDYLRNISMITPRIKRQNFRHLPYQWLMSQHQKDVSFTTEENVCIEYNFQTFWSWDMNHWDTTSVNKLCLKIWKARINFQWFIK